MSLGHGSPLEETAVFVVVQSLLGEKMGFLFGLCVLQVLLMLGYPLLLFLLGCAMVLIHFLKKKKTKQPTTQASFIEQTIMHLLQV
jgi:putative Mn2+ efflux pump MntP